MLISSLIVAVIAAFCLSGIETAECRYNCGLLWPTLILAHKLSQVEGFISGAADTRSGSGSVGTVGDSVGTEIAWLSSTSLQSWIVEEALVLDPIWVLVDPLQYDVDAANKCDESCWTVTAWRCWVILTGSTQPISKSLNNPAI